MPWEITVLHFKRNIQTLDFQISRLALYYLSYPGSIDDTGLNLSLESNAMHGIVVCNTIVHHLTGKLILFLFIYSVVLNQIDKYTQTYNLCFQKLQISREKFEPEPEFEPRAPVFNVKKWTWHLVLGMLGAYTGQEP